MSPEPLLSDRLLASEQAKRAYLNETLFHAIIDLVRYAERSGRDPVEMLGAVVADACLRREKLLQEAVTAALRDPAAFLRPQPPP